MKAAGTWTRREGLRLARILLLDSPVMLLFALFMTCSWLHHVHDRYWLPMMKEMVWTKSRKERESTYYRRICDEQDVTTSDPADLYLPEGATPQDAYEHQLKHGLTLFPKVLSESNATALRAFVHDKNYKLTEEESLFVIANKNRYSMALGTEVPVVADALTEIFNHDLFVSSLELMMGKDPSIIELSTITSTYGADAQTWHDDTLASASAGRYGRTFGPSLCVFIQLQNTTKEMGATQVCPGSHFCPSGDEDEFCEEKGFQVGNDEGVWEVGDAVLMNMDIHHRGPAHVLKGGPDRVMVVITFTPKPRTRAETRQMGQGIVFAQRWDMWGFTVGDFANTRERMGSAWIRVLRALGLYKAHADASWGVSYIRGCAMRIASDDFGFSTKDTEEFMESGGIKFLPAFLHGHVGKGGSAHDYYFLTLLNVKRFAMYMSGASISIYAFLVFFLGLMQSTTSKGSGTRSEAVRNLRSFLVRITSSHVIMIFMLFLAVVRVDNTEWAREIRAKRLYSQPFGYEDNDFGGPSTMPHRKDILIETRYKSDFMHMYNDFIMTHPGNQVYKQYLTDLGPLHPLYHGQQQNDRPSSSWSSSFSSSSSLSKFSSTSLPPIFRDMLAESVVEAMRYEGRRFLYQAFDSSWIVMKHSDAVRQVKLDLAVRAHPMIYRMSREVDFLLSETKYGWLRHTTMSRYDSYVILTELKRRIVMSSTETTTTTTSKKETYNTKFIRPAGRRRRKRKSSSPSSTMTMMTNPRRSLPPAATTTTTTTNGGVVGSMYERQGRRPPQIHGMGGYPGEPELDAWLQEGDLVEVAKEEEVDDDDNDDDASSKNEPKSHWYGGRLKKVLSTSKFIVVFGEDDNEESFSPHHVRRFRPYEQGDLDVEIELDGQYMEAEIVEVYYGKGDDDDDDNDDDDFTVFDVHVLEEDEYIEAADLTLFRRPM